jgi:hypothetical protein
MSTIDALLYTLISLSLVLAVYLFFRGRKLAAVLKFGILVLLVVPVGMAQNVTILDDKPIVLPEIGRGLEEIGISTSPMIGLPDPDMRDYYSEEMAMQMMYAAFLQDENMTNCSLFYA